jgi:hypothetical protein
MKKRSSWVLVGTAAFFASSLALGCATRQDTPDAGTARADGGRADGGAPVDGGGGGTDGGAPSDGGSSAMDTTVSGIQNNTIPPGACVRVSVVAMSVVFDDRDDTFLLDGGRIARKAFYVSETGLTTTAARTGIEVVVNTDVTPPTVAPGDALTIEGEYNENFNNSTIRLSRVCGSVVKTGTATMPAPLTVTIGEAGQSGGSSGCPPSGAAWIEGTRSEELEGVLIKVTTGQVSQARDSFGQFEISDGTGKLQVSPHFGVSAAPNVGDTIGATGVTGFSHFSFCRRKLRPRSDSEIGITTAAPNCGSAAKADHLLITEVRVGGSGSEFVEIHNPTSGSIDLSDYYLYNATFSPSADGGTDGGTQTPCRYYNTPSGTQCGTTNNDFALQFPAGAMIAAGEYQIVAVTSAANYCASNSCPNLAAKPNYEIPPPAGCGSLADDAEVPNMRGNFDSSAANYCPQDGGTTFFGMLTGSSEEIVLFKWASADAKVTDVDYFVWGTSTSVRTDKTGVSGYVADTAVDQQHANTGSASNSQSFQRICMNEGSETRASGNGISGNDETSENLDVTFVISVPTPKAATVGATP